MFQRSAGLESTVWALIAAALCASTATAAVIGASQAALPITAERIATLPAQDRAAWTAYLKRSQDQSRIDHATLAAELKPGQAAPAVPPENANGRTMPLDKPAAWYGTPEARHVADVIVSFQTPAGGWSKNQARNGPLRQPGQSYAADNMSKYPGANDFDAPHDPHWNYVGTFDNNATITEMRFLARVSSQTPGKEGDPYRASFLKGVRYILNAQFPNGGWPQVWPLEGGYHDAITYNDDAVSEAADLLTDVAEGAPDYGFAPAQLKAEAAKAATHGLDCILATQVKINGVRTIWAQQHDALTLVPEGARNFEPAELSTAESADLLDYLMKLPHPSPALAGAIHDGVAWLKTTGVMDVAYGNTGDPTKGRMRTDKPGAGPIWARYYSKTTGRPVFGDRDKTIHDDVNDLTLERRNGYAWYNTAPLKTFEIYAVWSKAHPKA